MPDIRTGCACEAAATHRYRAAAERFWVAAGFRRSLPCKTRAAKDIMLETPLYPLRFAPIFQYRLWGGRRLADWQGEKLPDDGPIGEAWLLSDRDDHTSCVLD